MARTVLVIEDDPGLRQTICHFLSEGLYDVLGAADGEEALAILTRNGPRVDAVVIDAVMPQRLGEAIVRQIQSVTPDVKVLYMSGYSQAVLTSLGTLTVGGDC